MYYAIGIANYVYIAGKLIFSVACAHLYLIKTSYTLTIHKSYACM